MTCVDANNWIDVDILVGVYSAIIVEIVMNSKEEILRRTLDHRDYSFESKYNHETSPKKSYYDAPSGYGNKFHEDDVEGLADHELKREREKTRILEERLKNKEIFINQMKEFQKELTRAFD